MLFVDVIVKQRNRAQSLTYSVPAHILPYIRVGCIVEVPLRKLSVEALVAKLRAKPPKIDVRKIRDVSKVLDGGYSPRFVEMVEALASHYCASLPEVAFHAMKYDRDLPVEGQITREKIFLQASYSERVDFYLKLLDKTKSGESVIFIFSELAYCEHFKSLVKRLGYENIINTGSIKDYRRYIAKPDGWIIISTLQALFYPITGGYIVLDQPSSISTRSSQRPFMQATTIADTKSAIYGNKLVLADTIPTYQTLLEIENGQTKLFGLKSKNDCQLTVAKSQQNQLINDNACELIGETLIAKGKVLILSSDIGTSEKIYCLNCKSLVECRECGQFVVSSAQDMQCPKCQAKYANCPICHKANFKKITDGVEQINAFVRSRFMQARIAKLYGSLSLTDDYDIVVATEKIFTLPEAIFDLIIVANIDRLLFMTRDDGEWQIAKYLLEVRSRSKVAYVQTKSPEEAIWSLDSSNMLSTFKERLAERKEANLPPYVDMVRLSRLGIFSDEEIDQLKSALKDIAVISVGEQVEVYRLGRKRQQIEIYLPKKLSLKDKEIIKNSVPMSYDIEID